MPQQNEVYKSYLAHISASNSSFRLNEGGEGSKWLTSTPEEFRSWEYYYLKNLSDASEIKVELTRAKPLKAVYSPDDKLIAVSLDNGEITLFDSKELKEIKHITGIHSSSVYAAQFSEDGKYLYSVSRDSFLCKTDIENGKLIWKVQSGGQGLADIDIHSDKIALSSWFFEKGSGVKGFVALFSAIDGRRTWYSEYGVKPVTSVRFSKDGKLVAAGTWGWRVGVWKTDGSTADYSLFREFDYDDVKAYSAIDYISFSQNGKFISAASKSGVTRTWDLNLDTLINQYDNRSRGISAVMFSENDEVIYTGGFDGTITLWHREKGLLLKKLFGHTLRILSMESDHSGKGFVTVSDDNSMRIWNFRTGRDFTDFRFRHKYTWAFALSPDGSYLIANNTDSTVAVWDAESGVYLKTIQTIPSFLNDACISPDNNSFAGIDWGGNVVLWDIRSGKVIHRFAGQTRGGAKLAFSPDGSRISAVSTEKALFTWNTNTGSLINKLPLKSVPLSVVYMHDGSAIYIGLNDGTIIKCDGNGSRILDSFSAHNSAIYDLDVSADNKYLLTCSEDKLIKKWDVTFHSDPVVMSGHEARVYTAKFINGTTRIVSGSADNTTRIWNSGNGDLILINSDATDPVYNIRIYPDGARILINSSGKEFILLDGRK